jgi:hypothetical protein
MSVRSILTALLLMLALPAQAAETPMSAEQFESYSTGRTLTFGFAGRPYGIEEYLPGREVIWQFVGEECRRGIWYQEAEQICFVYEHDPTPQCWTFFLTDRGLRARFAGDPPGMELVEVEQARQPLICPGPRTGV